MRNQWEAFDDDDEVEIPKTTSNPIRKIKKKLRKKEERYKKNHRIRQWKSSDRYCKKNDQGHCNY